MSRENARYVQTQHPMTKDWVKIDRYLGAIVGRRKKKYPIPVARKKDETK